MRKLTYEYVKQYVETESDSGCLLLSNEYKGNKIPLEFRCRCGETFYRRFDNFKTRKLYLCEKCSKVKNNESKTFKYDEVLDYVLKNGQGTILLSNSYKNSSTPLTFKCRCGKEFKTTFSKFKASNKRQCNKCSNRHKMSYDEVLEYVSKTECTLVSKEFKGIDDKLVFKCKCGELFERSFYNFKIFEKRCPKCREDEKSLNMSLEYEYVKSYIEKYNAKLLSKEYKNAKTKLNIQCECGRKFKADFDKIKSRGKVRCNVCSKKTSTKEFIISQKLEALNIKYIEQYKFDDCIYKDKLIFDFYIPSLNTCIEYDGEGHYKPFRFSKDKEAMKKKLEETQIRDAIKTQYCKDNNIKLIRIPYFEFDNIDEILKCLL